MLVLFRHRNIATVLNEIHNLRDAKGLRLDGESLSDNVGDIVLEHPQQRFVVIEIQSLHILDRDRLAEDPLVDGSAEVTIQRTTFVQSLSDHPADELEEHQVLGVDVTEYIGVEGGPVRGDRNEQCVVGVEHLSRHDLEPFSSDTSGVDSFFAVETNIEFAEFHLLR